MPQETPFHLKLAHEQRGDTTPTQTALEGMLNVEQLGWLETYVAHQYDTLDASLYSWRRKMERFERRMNEYFDDRRGQARSDKSGGQTIFSKSNTSLHIVGGFADFMFSQAREDIFGTRPYFRARALKGGTVATSQLLTRHSTWKLEHSNTQQCYEEAGELATHLGTAHIKQVWRREKESYWSKKKILVKGSWPIVTTTGEYIFEKDALAFSAAQAADEESGSPEVAEGWRPQKDPETLIPADARFDERLVEEQLVSYDNVHAANVHWKDICWNETAAELDLIDTDVFHRFQIGLLDAQNIYSLTDEQTDELRGNTFTGILSGVTEPRVALEENSADRLHVDDSGRENAPVVLCEGYIRVDIFEDGNPVRIFAVFSPFTKRVYRMDFLANITPGGELPIKPVRVYRQPQRAYGRGFHERYEMVQEFIDQNFNCLVYSNRLNRLPITAIQRNAVMDDLDSDGGITLDPDKVYELKPDRTVDDFIQFAKMPDGDDRTMELITLMIELAQLRTGISSAAQGELSSLPQASTATGIKQLMSRAATLLKWPIDKMRDDMTKALRYGILLIYANHNDAETFTWAEGEYEAEMNTQDLVDLPRDNPAGVLDFEIKIEMVQSQNEDALNTTAAAMGTAMQWIQVPEMEKVRLRSLWVENLKALGFEDAHDKIREPFITAEDVILFLSQAAPHLLMELGLEAPIQEPGASPAAQSSPKKEQAVA